MATLTVYSDAADGYILSADQGDGETDGDYAAARGGTGNVLTASATNVYAGQDALDIGTGDGIYRCYEGFVSFDTSALTSGATISAAVLSLYPSADSSTTDFTIQARLRDWGATLTTGDYVAGASLSALTLLATYATSGGWSGAAYKDFTDVALPANVSKTGTTYLLLSSSRHSGNNTPTGAEYVIAYSSEQAGSTQDPKITVTYTPAPPAGSQTVAHHVPIGAIAHALWGGNGWK